MSLGDLLHKSGRAAPVAGVRAVTQRPLSEETLWILRAASSMMDHMDNRQKVVLFSSAAVILAASTAVIAANQSGRLGFVIVPLVLMGFCLFAAGYYAGVDRGRRL